MLERGDAVGAAWREARYDRLHLHTVRWLSGLPGWGMLRTSAGDVEAEHVIVATGCSNEPWIPDWGEFAGELTHSAAHRNAEPYRGRDVLVVGSGDSGSEIAVDLAEGGARRVRLSVRTPPNIVRRDRLGVPSQLVGIALGPLPAPLKNPIGRVLRLLTIPDLSEHGLPPPARPFDRFQRTRTVPILDVGFVDAVRRGEVEVVPGVERCEGREVLLADGTRIAPDAIVAATGFRTGLEPLVARLGVLDEHAVPRARDAAPGLHFVAMTVDLGGLLRRAARDARELALALGRQLEQQTPEAPAARAA